MKKFYKYSGVDFYEKYVLPTNPSSRNKFIKNIWLKTGLTDKESNFIFNHSIDVLNKRIKFAYLFGGIHSIGIIVHLFDDSIFTASNILINIYPALVQIKIHNRLQSVLKHKKNKEEIRLEKDIMKIESINTLNNKK